MKLLIVDDEAPARERLAALVAELTGPWRVIGEATSGEQMLALCSQHDVDLVLLDIRMPGMGGLAAASRLAERQAPPAVVFITAYDEFALQAFEQNAVGYLLKPVRLAQLARALERAGSLTRPQLRALDDLQPSSPRRSHICAVYRGNLQTVPIEQVRCFRAEAKYVLADFGGGELLLEESLKSLERDFSGHLLRIHRNALVGKAYISGLEKGVDQRYRLRLSGVAGSLEISRRHLPEVRKWLKGGGEAA